MPLFLETNEIAQLVSTNYCSARLPQLWQHQRCQHEEEIKKRRRLWTVIIRLWFGSNKVHSCILKWPQCLKWWMYYFLPIPSPPTFVKRNSKNNIQNLIRIALPKHEHLAEWISLLFQIIWILLTNRWWRNTT